MPPTSRLVKSRRKKLLLIPLNACHFRLLVVLLTSFVLLDWLVFPRSQEPVAYPADMDQLLETESKGMSKHDIPAAVEHDYLLGLATHALAEAESKVEADNLWTESFVESSAWKPCADSQTKGTPPKRSSTGFITIIANGGLNQQRVAVCNAVAVARLLNATLVIPRFLFSNVWEDHSQFGDIYQQDYFIDYLKEDLVIVKELPIELQSLDLAAIGSHFNDADVIKEAKPSFYLQIVLPVLLRNGVVQFDGFGHRLAFDPIPFHIQRLRCKCNFHGLTFCPDIQDTGELLIRRMREHSSQWGPLSTTLTKVRGSQSDAYFGMPLMQRKPGNASANYLVKSAPRFLALHLRFEIDMVAFSMCDLGQGEQGQQALEVYRETHFPRRAISTKEGKFLSSEELRRQGRCPLTPEEAGLMLVALGFKRGTPIYLAGTHIFGGQSRMVALMSLYPNIVTKEDLLSAKEIRPFVNRSSQLAALDFIVSAAANAFAMTDSGSQFAALVAGQRIYYGGGSLPTIRPNKRRLQGFLSKSPKIEWEEFGYQVRKMIKEAKRPQVRPIARSVYRHPRCKECMCIASSTKKRA